MIVHAASANDRAIPRERRLSEIDPLIAWERWTPSESEPWDRRRVSLLYRRGGFGACPAEIDAAVAMEPSAVVDLLCSESQDVKRQQAFELESSTIEKAVRGSNDSKRLAAWWLHRMLHNPSSLVEKMTLFWHGHFATGAEKVNDSELMFEQNRLLRDLALGDFRQLVQRVSKDPAMLIYLDSVTNRKSHANENYARELMELFCLGEGNYTEHDVQELARCFTGWEIRRKQFRFNSFQHDSGTKTLFGSSMVVSGEEAIDAVVNHPSMPRFIVGKLFRFFVCDEPEPSAELLKPLENTFIQSGRSIRAVVHQILASRLMLSGWSIGRRVRSPVELAIELLRTLQCTTNLDQLANRLQVLGQSLFYPPNVKGWDGGRAWINSSTLIGRANLIYDLMNDENTRFDGETLDRNATKRQLGSTEAYLNWFNDAFLAQPLADAERRSVLERSAAAPQNKRLQTLIIELGSLPKIHLS